MKKFVISGIVAVMATAMIGCETAPTNTSNVKVNGNTVANNTAVVVNNNANVGMNTGNTNRELTRDDFDRDKARYESEAKETGSKFGTGANDLWLLTKTRAAFLATDDLRESTINVDVDNAVVTLRGSVGSAAQKTAAVNVAKDIDGVTRVNDQLKVQPGDSMTNMSGSNTRTNTNTNR